MFSKRYYVQRTFAKNGLSSAHEFLIQKKQGIYFSVKDEQMAQTSPMEGTKGRPLFTSRDFLFIPESFFHYIDDSYTLEKEKGQ